MTLNDGRSFRLRGSNDVDDDNKGIIVLKDLEDEDSEVYLEWDEFDKIDFNH